LLKFEGVDILWFFVLLIRQFSFSLFIYYAYFFFFCTIGSQSGVNSVLSAQMESVT
jgi:hypothetical protein